MMHYLNFVINRVNPENIKFYGYRRASLKTTLVSFDRYDRKIKELEKRLYDITGEIADNHVLFEITIDEDTFALQFTDGIMRLGLGVKKQRW